MKSLSFCQSVLLAPMEDITDRSYRIFCKQMGADVVYTEFVNSDGLIRNCPRAFGKSQILEEERPIGIQIYGQNIESMVAAAKTVEQLQPDLIDINAGCWVKKVCRRGAGSGLMRDPEYLHKMVVAIKKAVSVPVTVKTRIGWDEDSINILEVSQAIQDAGASAITIHGRTRAQGHSGLARWDWIAKIKSHLKIPVILNGGVFTPQDALRAFEQTGADGVMIARGAIGQPWIFREIKELLAYGEIRTLATLQDRVQICLSHLQKHIAFRGVRNIPVFRKYYAHYLKGFPYAIDVRKKLLLLSDFGEIQKVLLDYATSGSH